LVALSFASLLGASAGVGIFSGLKTWAILAHSFSRC